MALKDERVPDGHLPERVLLRGRFEQLLKHSAIISRGERVTVHELIKHYANREGGVHVDPEPPDAPLLREVLGSHEEALRLTVVAVGRVVHRALEPLAARVLLRDRPHPYGLQDGEEGGGEGAGSAP